jgi:hypothetical protein
MRRLWLALIVPMARNESMDLNAEQARAIAASGYIFLFPLVSNYCDLYAEVLDSSSEEFGGGVGNWVHHRYAMSRESSVSLRHHTTLDSSVWLDLRSGPWALSTPASERGLALVTDLWGFAAHEARDSFGDTRPALIADHDWIGEAPPHVGRITRAETDFVRCQVHLELTGPGDLDMVRRVQQGFSAEPIGGRSQLSTAPKPPGHGWWPVDDRTLTSEAFWPAAAFALSLVTPVEEDRSVFALLAEIGIRPGARWDSDGLDSELRDALGDGMDRALTDLMRAAGRSRPSHRLSRDDFDRDYTARAVASFLGGAGPGARYGIDLG